MIVKLLPHIIRFILLVLLQVLVLNNIQLHGTINPYIYPLFILLLPLKTQKSLLLVLGFGIGFLVDVFSDSIGMHAAAGTLIAFLRPTVVRILTPRQGYEMIDSPTLGVMGIQWVLTYTVILFACHHFLYFVLEVMSSANLVYFFFKFLVSTLVSIVLAIALQYLFKRSK